MIDEPVYLEKHNPFWKKYFIDEQQRIKTALDIDSTSIEHIGSTAIPNIYAKPIIDIMIGIETFSPLQYISNKLINLGYEALGQAGVPNRFYFRYRKSKLFNVHVVEREGMHWINNLVLRDYLQTHPEKAKCYEQAKMKAVQSGTLSLLKYSEAKSKIIEKLILQALIWQKDI